MASEQYVSVPNFPQSNSIQSTDFLVGYIAFGADSNTALISTFNLFNNASCNLTVTNGSTFILSAPPVPSNSSSNGVPGQISWDQSYLYLAVNTNTWTRIALSSF
jgi:hypothetical protein